MVREIVPEITATVNAKTLKTIKKENSNQEKNGNVRTDNKIKIANPKIIGDRNNRDKPANNNRDVTNKPKDNETIIAGPISNETIIVVSRRQEETIKDVPNSNETIIVVSKRQEEIIKDVPNSREQTETTKTAAGLNSKDATTKTAAGQKLSGEIKTIKNVGMKPSRDAGPNSKDRTDGGTMIEE